MKRRGYRTHVKPMMGPVRKIEPTVFSRESLSTEEQVELRALEAASNAALEAASNAAIDDYQRGLEAAYNSGNRRVINISGDSERPFFVEPHDPGDDETTITSRITDAPRRASVQHLDHGEPDQELGAFQASEPERPAAAPMKLIEPPGAWVMRLAAFLPGRERLRKDLEQVVADMREEHFEALAAGDADEAKLALRRGRLACVHTVFPSWLASLVAVISKFFGLA